MTLEMFETRSAQVCGGCQMVMLHIKAATVTHAEFLVFNNSINYFSSIALCQYLLVKRNR